MAPCQTGHGPCEQGMRVTYGTKTHGVYRHLQVVNAAAGNNPLCWPLWGKPQAQYSTLNVGESSGLCFRRS